MHNCETCTKFISFLKDCIIKKSIAFFKVPCTFQIYTAYASKQSQRKPTCSHIVEAKTIGSTVALEVKENMQFKQFLQAIYISFFHHVPAHAVSEQVQCTSP